jgi:hypothetical protein
MKTRGNGKGRAAPAARGGRVGRGRPQNDADEARDDVRAEINDISAALDSDGASAGAAPPRPPRLPDALLARRLDKEKADKERAIKENELLQNKLNDMQAELELAKANVGAVIQVQNPATPSASKVLLNLLFWFRQSACV